MPDKGPMSQRTSILGEWERPREGTAIGDENLSNISNRI